jgi:glycosyltransferase involved in cell wall biosynthesis
MALPFMAELALRAVPALSAFRPCVGIPTYNNASTIADVVRRARAVCPDVLVINDGSTDGSGDRAATAGAWVETHPENRGKGEAIKTALRAAKDRGFSHLVTLDGDGQHHPEDMPALIDAAQATPDALIIGQRDQAAIPGRNRFGNAISNVWVNWAMGARLSDTQCGFRVYPTAIINHFRFRGRGYELETEVLIRQARARRPVVPIPVRVYYPPIDERVSHFRPRRDATKIVFLVMRFLFLPRRFW